MVITLILLLIGICLQFLAPLDGYFILILPAAALIIFFAPLAIPEFDRMPARDKRAKIITKWHSIPEKSRKSTFDRITSTKYKLNLNPLERLFGILTDLPCVIIAAIISIIIFFIDCYHLSALIFDIICVPRAFFFIIYGCNPICRELEVDTYPLTSKIATMNFLLANKEKQTNYTADVQLELTKQGSITGIRDIRCNLIPKQDIPKLLCAQFSITENKVKERTYPYAYLVIVFKGLEFAHCEPIRHQIAQILDRKANCFGLDIKEADGNSIFVITKYKDVEYTTFKADCEILVKATNSIFGYFLGTNLSKLAQS
ncbi:MAG: hypothetical protein IKY83_09080 [Proteobacteria bacterium]|nr:hypothetical protein [Pseudomonadota bacterium]